MSTVLKSTTDGIAVLTLARGKVNAIDDTLLDDLATHLSEAEADDGVDGIVLTGRGSFFSFGFDVPALLAMPRASLTRFLTKHTTALLRLFTSPLPIIAAINGHATAGGCMIALACDQRVAAEGRARIGLNEIDLGVSVFRGSAEMLRYWIGCRNAELVLGEGALHPLAAAKKLGLVDDVVPPDQLLATATARARTLGDKPKTAHRALKKLLRGEVTERIVAGEPAALDEFIDTWYSAEAQSILARLQIRD